MSVLSIITIDSELLDLRDIILRQIALEVPVYDSKFLTLCQKLAVEMFKLIYSNDGAALAAPQVGIALRLIVMDPKKLDFGPHVLINPVIEYKSEEEVIGLEGCLSLPSYKGEVPRSAQVLVRAYDLRGELKHYHAKGWLARIFQHEIDHLDGVLYPDLFKRGDWLLESDDSDGESKAEKVIEKLLE
jgi:peptide deformylase